ncbi:indolepyruvate ferredoxin oxidoreductase family protein [Pseudomonas sp. KCJK9016]|uniref:indolepyruvate ferredoxin oxidoreductase family protein n=1 Tax=Pseudomonas sp. KCJK9016 TaxID=3344556 RepID=UPI003906099A
MYSNAIDPERLRLQTEKHAQDTSTATTGKGANTASQPARKSDPHPIYSRESTTSNGRVFLSGQQALVRLLLSQSALDRANGLHTAGFVSGYRGSPLGGVDRELMKARDVLENADIRFLPAINEDLAATALIGTQRVETDPNKRYDGVFGLWYGKGPGVDRSGDAIKHGNFYGSSPTGGVLVVTGDDHGCVSSSMSHQSDRTLMAWGLPVIHPAGLADYERCGLWGWALSRVSGLWVGFKAITETVEATTSVESLALPRFVTPEIDPGPDGLHWRWPDLPGMQIERRVPYKFDAARAFAVANPIDVAVTAPAQPRLVIGAVGKAYGDVRQALQQGGVSLEQLEKAGVALLKINLVYPLSPVLEAWAKRTDQVLIVEEKQAIVEEQLKQALYNAEAGQRAVILGKRDERGAPLISDHEELRPSRLAPLLQARLQGLGITLSVPEYWYLPVAARAHDWVRRTPYLCSGCPHNTSTRVPEGSEARLGIGCHAMAARMPERSTSGSVQMGGEGVDWLGQAPFVETPHIFQNIGDGTFFHSGYLAIRQAIAAGATITYKLLHNDAVAMTGGQPIDGKLTVKKAVELMKAEGAHRVVVVADDPQRFEAPGSLPQGVELFHRERLEEVQLQLRETRGVSVLVFDQVCAIEGRRRKKQLPVPAVKTEVVINEAVCEGCGDCQVKSNCLSVTPVATPFGTKRRIDPHGCNTDLSCIKGFCPSFVTVTGKPRAQRRRQADSRQVLARAEALALPSSRSLDSPYEMLLAGIGGTGIVTVARTVALAAHLDGRAVSVLDFTGFAQKGGSVLSHVRLANAADALHQHRIDLGGADLLLAADLVVASEDDALSTLRADKTVVIANTAQTQTGAMLRNPELRIETAAIQAFLKQRVGAEHYHALDAAQLANTLVDPMQANMLLLGYAWQRGTVPVSLEALKEAIDQAGSAAANHLAFAWGRLWAQEPAFVMPYLDPASNDVSPVSIIDFSGPRERIERLVETRSEFLTHYQNAAYAARYRNVIDTLRSMPAVGDHSPLTEAVARNLFKLMAYKDEYEVARLLTDSRFMATLKARFESGVRFKFHFALPLMRNRKGSNGEPKKIAVSGWVLPLLKVLAKGRVLRHTRFDPLGWSAERREERRLLLDYEQTLQRLLPNLNAENLPLFVEWANLPESIRGYGHVKERSIAAARQREKDLIVQIVTGSHSLTTAPVVETWQPNPTLAPQARKDAAHDVEQAS